MKFFSVSTTPRTLASPRVASSLDDGLDKIKRVLAEAAAQGAEIVCFPEAYLPGLRGVDFEAQLVLDRGEVPAVELDLNASHPARLGWVSWAKTRPMK